MSLGLWLALGPVEEGDERCTRSDGREPSRDPRDEQGEDPCVKFLGLGLGLTCLEFQFAAPEEIGETREACDTGADQGDDPCLEFLGLRLRLTGLEF